MELLEQNIIILLTGIILGGILVIRLIFTFMPRQQGYHTTHSRDSGIGWVLLLVGLFAYLNYTNQQTKPATPSPAIHQVSAKVGNPAFSLEGKLRDRRKSLPKE